jgi:hypothetical protein
MVNEVRLLQLEKAYAPMKVVELGIVIDDSPLQYWNAQASMNVTELPMVADIKPLHAANARLPMETTESGMFTDVRPTKLLHRLAGITLTFPPKMKLVILEQS